MTDDVITRMREKYAELLGQGWKVTLHQAIGFDFMLTCRKDDFIHLSIALEPYKSITELNHLAELDCVQILHNYQSELEKQV